MTHEILLLFQTLKSWQKIGKKAVYDIDVTVEPKAEEALILNNSVLSRFGAFTLNEETLELIFE